MALSKSDETLIDEILEKTTNVVTHTNENTNVNGMVNDGCKQKVYFELTQTKQQIIMKLEKCHYRTAPKRIAELLTDFFKEWGSESGHWLYIAQKWNPRAINRVIKHLVKIHKKGAKTIKNAAAYFTFLIKKRKERRSL